MFVANRCDFGPMEVSDPTGSHSTRVHVRFRECKQCVSDWSTHAATEYLRTVKTPPSSLGVLRILLELIAPLVSHASNLIPHCSLSLPTLIYISILLLVVAAKNVQTMLLHSSPFA